jgi:hypothetical protein
VIVGALWGHMRVLVHRKVGKVVSRMNFRVRSERRSLSQDCTNEDRQETGGVEVYGVAESSATATSSGCGGRGAD